MAGAREARLAVAIAVAILLPAANAGAFTAFESPVTGQVSFVTGIPGTPSPVFDFVDDGSHLFVDVGDRNMYRLPASGGDVADAQAHNANSAMMGLARVGGHYYGVADGKIHEVDPTTLALGPELAPGWAALEPDPRTSDVYTESGAPGIVRVRGLTSGAPTTTVVVPTGTYSGLAFNAAGTTLYASDLASHHVVGFDRSFKQVFDVNLYSTSPTGIDVAPPHSTMNGVDVSDDVFVNTSSGTVVRIDVHHANAVTTVASGGVPGDSLHFDSHGFLDSAQRTEIVRLLPRVMIRPPAVLARPHISGTLRRGKVLRCVGARFRNTVTSYSYSWRRGGARIPAANRPAHTIVAADLDKRLTCTVVARNGGGEATATSEPVRPQRRPRCAIAGKGLRPTVRCDHAALVSLRPRLRAAGSTFNLPRVAHRVRRGKRRTFPVKLTRGARHALREHAGVLSLRVTAAGAGGARHTKKKLRVSKL